MPFEENKEPVKTQVINWVMLILLLIIAPFILLYAFIMVGIERLVNWAFKKQVDPQE